jgi:hypothetical protein
MRQILKWKVSATAKLSRKLRLFKRSTLKLLSNTRSRTTLRLVRPCLTCLRVHRSNSTQWLCLTKPSWTFNKTPIIPSRSWTSSYKTHLSYRKPSPTCYYSTVSMGITIWPRMSWPKTASSPTKCPTRMIFSLLMQLYCKKPHLKSLYVN